MHPFMIVSIYFQIYSLNTLESFPQIDGGFIAIRWVPSFF